MGQIEAMASYLKLGNLVVEVEAKPVGKDVAIYDKKRDVVILHQLDFDDEKIFVRDEYAKWAAIHAAICYGGADEFLPGSKFELPNLADPELGKRRSRSVEYLLIHREIPPELRKEYAERRIREYEYLIKLGATAVAELFRVSEVPRPEDLIPSFEESIDALRLWQHCYVTGKWCELH